MAWLGRLSWPRSFSFRRFGLGVSIAGAMGASAIGGGLLAAREPLPVAMAVPDEAQKAVVTAQRAAKAAPADDHHAMPVAEVPAVAGSAAAPLILPAGSASAVLYADAALPAASGPVQATVIPVAASGPEQRPAVPAQTPPVDDLTFGLDVNGDGIPDSLERFVRKAIDAPATRVAARRYYRVALPLAAVAEQGEPLTVADQSAVFRAAECYLLSAAEDGLSDVPNLNDRASLTGAAAARRMQALAEALRGFDYRVGGVRRQSCN